MWITWTIETHNNRLSTALCLLLKSMKTIRATGSYTRRPLSTTKRQPELSTKHWQEGATISKRSFSALCIEKPPCRHQHGVSPLKVGSLSCIDMELLAKHRHGASTKHLCRALANLKTGFSPSMQVLFTPCYERSAVVSALRRCPPRSAPRCP